MKSKAERNKTKTTGKSSEFLRILNPANLSDEIKAMGGSLSLPKAIAIFFLYVLVLIGLGFAFKLSVPFIIGSGLACLIFLPGTILRVYKKRYYSQRFSDVTSYMLQMIDSFRVFKKISKAIDDTLMIFPEGEMHDALVEARSILINGTEGNNEAHALYAIEKRFPCKKLTTLHSFLIRGENIGGNINTGLDIITHDRALWVESIKNQQVVTKGLKRLLLISIIACTAIIIGAEWYLSGILPIFDSVISQITTVILLLADVGLYCIADRLSTINWIDTTKVDENIVKKYNAVLNFDVKKACISATIQSIPVLAIIPLVIITDWKILYIGLILIPYFWANQFIRQKTWKKDVQRDIEISFCSWIIQLGLELQTNTVQGAIANSLSYAPEVLKPEINLLLERLQEDPTSATPYVRFMEDFFSADINQTMRSLYAISAGSGGDIDARVKEMTTVAITNQNKIEKESEEDKAKAREFALLTGSTVPLAMKVGVDFLVAIALYMSDFLSQI